jgi:hypothetical protein
MPPETNRLRAYLTHQAVQTTGSTSHKDTYQTLGPGENVSFIRVSILSAAGRTLGGGLAF